MLHNVVLANEVIYEVKRKGGMLNYKVGFGKDIRHC